MAFHFPAGSVEPILAHSFILDSKSDFLSRTFKSGALDKKDGKMVITSHGTIIRGDSAVILSGSESKIYIYR